MEYTFFYIMIALALLSLPITAGFVPIKPAALVTGLVYIGYSLLFDITFGERLGLYYYINPAESTLFIMLAAVFIYAPLNVAYLAFAPSRPKSIAVYTAFWVAGMLAIEYVSLKTGTIVFTGWSVFPWSVLTYLVSYSWSMILYGYLDKRMKRTGAFTLY